ncbi:MAG: enoyl-ACP reductase [Acidobacteriota bacterium]|nr:MAG: enoyl-ACP reductase [Acidobacteriota bacterium]
MALLEGKTGLIFGVANHRSYAWHIAKALVAHGADCAFAAHPDEKLMQRAREAVDQLDLSRPWIEPCDAGRDEDLDAVFAAYARDHARLDFVVHSIAFADREWLSPGTFVGTPRQSYLQAIDISAYTLVAMADRSREQMAAGGGGSILAMTYYGSEKVVPGYNVMGVAKAALEASSRYLAADLGPDNIRVNTISGGPLRTLAASGIAGFRQILTHNAERAPLRRNVEGQDVGGVATFLVSDLSSGITGENIYVDCGVNTIGL